MRRRHRFRLTFLPRVLNLNLPKREMGSRSASVPFYGRFYIGKNISSPFLIGASGPGSRQRAANAAIRGRDLVREQITLLERNRQFANMPHFSSVAGGLVSLCELGNATTLIFVQCISGEHRGPSPREMYVSLFDDGRIIDTSAVQISSNACSVTGPSELLWVPRTFSPAV